MNLTEQPDLDELRKLEAEATKSPWRVDQRKVKGPMGRTCADMRYANGDADGRFIAAARNAMPDLLAELDRLREQLESVRAHCLKHQHSDVSPGVQLAYGEVLKLLEGK